MEGGTRLWGGDDGWDSGACAPPPTRGDKVRVSWSAGLACGAHVQRPAGSRDGWRVRRGGRPRPARLWLGCRRGQ